MDHFFNVIGLDDVFKLTTRFDPLPHESISVNRSWSRVLARDIDAPSDLPGFRRATMDGFAVDAASTFGASEFNPAWLDIQADIRMGDVPGFTLSPGKAARISTGGMLPKGADAVVMVEHTELVDDGSVEIYKSVAPLQNVIDASEDFSMSERVLTAGMLIRPQEQGVLAGLGIENVLVHQRPRVGIISTGDEIVPITESAGPGKIRDINSYALSGFIREAHAEPVLYGIVKDEPSALQACIETAVEETDMILISGGSSVGVKDYTIDVLSSLSDTKLLFHGISISPGKPTILAASGKKPVWGLPGQVTSAMVVMKIVVMPFLNRLKGLAGNIGPDRLVRIPATLTRNVSSTQGRRDFIRVRLSREENRTLARPILGKSGLIRTMIHADGLLEIREPLEGLEKDTSVQIILL